MQFALEAIDRVLLLAAVAAPGVILFGGLRRNLADPLKAAPPRPNHLHADTLALVVLLYLLSALLIGSAFKAISGNTESVAGTLLVGTSAQTVGIAVCLLVAARFFQGGVRSYLFASPPVSGRTFIAVMLLVGIVALGWCPLVRDATVRLIQQFAPEHGFAAHPTLQALNTPGHSIAVTIGLWTGAGLLAPFGEELFFRGLLQTFLLGVVRNRWRAIGITSLAFACVHVAQPHAMPALAVLGLLLGFAYERTGSLLPPILIHALFNLKTLLWETLSRAATPAATFT